MAAGEGVEHIGIAYLEGQGISGLPDPGCVGHIHNGVVTAVANDLDPVQFRDHHRGVAYILTAYGQNCPQASAFPGADYGLSCPVFGTFPFRRRFFPVDFHDLGRQAEGVFPGSGEGKAAANAHIHGVSDGAAQTQVVDPFRHLIDAVTQQQVDRAAAGDNVQFASDGLLHRLCGFNKKAQINASTVFRKQRTIPSISFSS